jgi:hypothetical protein
MHQVVARRARRSSGAVLLAFLCASSVHAQGNSESLRLLASIPLPQTGSPATDIRWASDRSIYVAWDRDGVAEIDLKGLKRRNLVPKLNAFNDDLGHYRHLAVSSYTLVVASQLWTTYWRPLGGNPGGDVPFHSRELAEVQDIDISGEKILMMGLAKQEHGAREIAPDGALAWVGTLSGRVEDFTPVLYDLGGPGAPSYSNCRARPMGAVRFLAEGSFVVAPSFQDGILLFNAEGRRIRSWTNEQVGLDTHADCLKMSRQDEEQFRLNPAFMQRWFNSHKVLDDVLPLPQGPGLLIRSLGTDGQAHWTLEVLKAGGLKSYTVPVSGRRPADRLHGDVRNGKIVLLLGSGLPWSRDPAEMPAEVFLLESPHP